MLEKRRQLSDPDGDVFVFLSDEQVCQLTAVLQLILTEYANDDMELFVGPRLNVMTCLNNLWAIEGA